MLRERSIARLRVAATLSLVATVPLCAAGEPLQSLSSAAADHGALSSDPARAGIWKAVSPISGSMHGEFDSHDPIGLAAGKKIATDCSLNWIDPDFGQRYCFSSATSLVYFLDAPRAYLARARKNWIELNLPAP